MTNYSFFRKYHHLIFIFLISLESKAFSASTEDLWSWKLDGIYYSINFEKNKTTFISDNVKTKIKNLKCSQNKMAEFRKKLQSKIESYDEKNPLPKGYPAIEVRAPKIGTFDVARGSELGLFLIDMKFEILHLQNMANLACQ